MEYCTKEQMADFYAEFNTDEETMKKDVQCLMEWMEKQPHLPNVKDEDFILNFLLRSKNQMERAKGFLERYYVSRVTMGELFQNRDPHSEDIYRALHFATYVPMPKLTPDGYRIIVFKIFNRHNELAVTPKDFMKTVQLQSDLGIKKDFTRGSIMIFDFENASLQYVILQMAAMKRLMEIGLNTAPFRMTRIISVNIMPLVDPIVRLGKSLVRKELSDRVIIWKKKSTELTELFPKEILSSTYGGDLPPIEEIRDMWYEHLKEHTEWFLSEENVKADLSKKPAQNQCKDRAMYGVEGSFRKIAID